MAIALLALALLEAAPRLLVARHPGRWGLGRLPGWPLFRRLFGLPAGWVESQFLLVLVATLVVFMQVLGVLLIAGATVIPPVAARMLSDRFQIVLLLSTGLGAVCGFVGIYISYFIDVSSGAAVVLVEAGVFALVMAYINLRPRRMPGPLGSVQPMGVGRPNPGETD